MSGTIPTPILDAANLPSWLQASRRPFHDAMYAFYSSEYGGIVTDPRLMAVPIDDHLTHRGDGVFETLKCLDGLVYCYQEHLARLYQSAESIALKPPWPRETVGAAMLDTIRAAGRRDCLVRLIISRGPGSMGISPTDSPSPNLYILVHEAKPPFMSAHPDGARVITSSLPVKPGDFARIKSCNYLHNAMLKKEASDASAHFAVNFDEHGFLAEGATENFGILDQNDALVVPRSGRILNGTTMNRILDLAESGLTEGWLTGVRRDDIPRDAFITAREVFIFGTTTDVTAVVAIDDQPVGDGQPGPAFSKLSALLLAEQRGRNDYTVAAFT